MNARALILDRSRTALARRRSFRNQDAASGSADRRCVAPRIAGPRTLAQLLLTLELVVGVAVAGLVGVAAWPIVAGYLGACALAVRAVLSRGRVRARSRVGSGLVARLDVVGVGRGRLRSRHDQLGMLRRCGTTAGGVAYASTGGGSAPPKHPQLGSHVVPPCWLMTCTN